MSKQNKIARLTSAPPPGARGRTAGISGDETDISGKTGAVKQAKMTDVNRGTGKPSKRGGANRGDRRDTNPTYTGNARHASRGNTPRVDVSTRKR